MFNNPFLQNSYGPSNNNMDQNYLNMIDREKEKLDKLRENYLNRFQQPTAINQTFQIASNNNGIKYVNSIEDVQKELTIVDTPFISNDFSILWIKTPKGEIRTFSIQEIKPKDEKDLLIEQLQKENEYLKGAFTNEQSNADVKSNDEFTSPNENESIDDTIRSTKSSSNAVSKSTKTK